MKNLQLQQINSLITSITKSMNSIKINDYDLQQLIIRLQTLKNILMDKNYIESSKTDSYLEKLSIETQAYLSLIDKK